LEGFAGNQLQNHVGTLDTVVGYTTKCVLVVIYESNGKTILQPLMAEQEAKTITELFKNETLEVRLSNGKTDISQFEVVTLKYKQVLHSLAKSKQTKSQVCLKNIHKNVASCKQGLVRVNTDERS
jgi:hypothetical protein